MATNNVVEGVFAINKPLGLTSAQVIRDCQKYFNPSMFFKPLVESEVQKRLDETKKSFKKRGFNKREARVKMGHGGTLDPLATGVLILGVGSGTKSLQSFLDCTKTYETTVLFGADTDTYDRTGRILTKRGYDHITRDMVEKELGGFRGKFEQIPPLYSALKMEGKPLYEYAREGKPIPREIIGRQVEVTELELVEWHEPGAHSYRWPTEEAETAEKNLAEQVWRVEKNQTTARKLTPEEAAEDERAASAHESLKRKFDQKQDELLPAVPGSGGDGGGGGNNNDKSNHDGKGENFAPPEPSADAPAPWSDKGPPAARIRMTVTSGFYVRSFCHDLGQKLGSAAMMSSLERSRQGDFLLGKNCLEYADVDKGEAVWGPKVAELLADWKEKHPGPAQKQDAFRNDRNQKFVPSRRQAPESDGEQPPGKRRKTGERSSDDNKAADGEAEAEASNQAPVPRRRNSSSDDEGGELARKPLKSLKPTKTNGQSAARAKQQVEETGDSDEYSEWDGIKD